MTVLLFAQPHDISAEGFLFIGTEDFIAKALNLTNQHGDPVEEFEIQFIDGEAFEYELARAWDLNQANIAPFFKAAEQWDEEQKLRFILAVGEFGYSFDPNTVDPDDFEVDIHRVDSMRDLAIEFVEEGLFGDIPPTIENYIDYDAIARDLALDYAEAVINGERLIYRCA